MYKIQLKFNGQTINEKEVGNWRDHAREKFAQVKRAIQPVNGKNQQLILLNPENEVELMWESEK